MMGDGVKWLYSETVSPLSLDFDLKGGNLRINKHSVVLAKHLGKYHHQNPICQWMMLLTLSPPVSSMSSERQESRQSQSWLKSFRLLSFLGKRSSDVCLLISINYEGRLFLDVNVKISVFFLTRSVHHDSLFQVTQLFILFPITSYWHWLFL